jgi:hypothetical protein
MSIRLICICGWVMVLPEKYAGQHVQCPDCNAMLRIPTPEENLSLTRWVCSCGQRLKARSRTAGRKLRCPNCSAEVSVPFAKEHTAFVEENFMLDDRSGIVQRVSETPHDDPQPAENARPPAAEPLVTNLLSAWPPEADQMQAPEPAPVRDSDEDVTRLNPRGPIFLAETGRTPAKSGAAGADEPAAARAQPAPVRKQSVRPAKPAAKTPQPAVATQVSEEEAYAQDVEEEGIHSPELLSYFNTKTGFAAARAALMHAPNGYRLCVLYALLAACMVNIAQLALSATARNAPAAVACLALPSLFSIFLWAGFVACVKDGVFERTMGVERMFYNAGIHFLRFTATSIIVAPIAVGLAFAGKAAIEALWGPAPFIGRVGIVALAFAAGLFVLELLLMPPVISVLEHRNAFSSLTRGLLFGLRRSWDLITITLASMVLFCAAAGAIYLFWWLANLLLSSALPAWLFDAAKQFLVGLIGAALMGQVVASLMLLYLSHVGDEERLQDIRDKLQGPAAVPMRMYATIAAAAVALLAMNCFRVEQMANGDTREAPPGVREPSPESAAPQPPAQP